MTENMDPGANKAIAVALSAARNWLFDAAGPLWASRGRTDSGLFAEKISLSGVPDPSVFRVFVQARHVFSFVQLGALGWQGPWAELVAETMAVLLRAARRPDGFWGHGLAGDGSLIDPRADLYDQAFLMLALAVTGEALGRSEFFDEIEDLTRRLETKWSHPMGGFLEGEVQDTSARRQNPHMHLLEAWVAAYEASGRVEFLERAESLARLCRERFIDAESGALLEFFDDGWLPKAGDDGQFVEPGHCFEWAWLFERLSLIGPDGARRREWTDASDTLSRFARDHGVCPRRGVALNGVTKFGDIADGAARLWPQTERLKAAVARFRRLRTLAEAQEIIAAARGLSLYLEVPELGLWRDRLGVDGAWVDEPSPGSSFYHISCAYTELINVR